MVEHRVSTVFLEKDLNPFGETASGRPRKKASKGKTAMKHARELVAARYPGSPVLEAQKRIVWIPDKHGPCVKCGRNLTSRTATEDFLGCFDLIVLGAPNRLIQVTTMQTTGDESGAASARRRKIRENYLVPFGARGRPDVWVWAWVARKHFLTWCWDWERGEWGERTAAPSPLIRRRQ